jgi:hypothetical protein
MQGIFRALQRVGSDEKHMSNGVFRWWTHTFDRWMGQNIHGYGWLGNVSTSITMRQQISIRLLHNVLAT